MNHPLHPFFDCTCNICKQHEKENQQYNDIARDIVMRTVQTSRLEGRETSTEVIAKRINTLTEQFIKKRPTFDSLEKKMEQKLCSCHCHESYKFERTCCERNQKEEDMVIVGDGPKKPSKVFEEFNALEEQVCKLEEAVKRLCIEVEPICTPLFPEDSNGIAGSNGGDMSKQTRSTVADKLTDLRRRISMVIENIVTTSGRLEL